MVSGIQWNQWNHLWYVAKHLEYLHAYTDGFSTTCCPQVS